MKQATTNYTLSKVWRCRGVKRRVKKKYFDERFVKALVDALHQEILDVHKNVTK